MNCPFARQIDDYVDDLLPAAGSAAFDAHLSGCGTCLTLVADLRRIRTAAATLQRHSPPPAVWQRIEQQIQPRRRWLPVLAWNSRAWMPALAGVVVLVLAIGLVRWSPFGRGASPASSSVAATPSSSAIPAAAPESVDAELTLAQQHYERAIAGLEQITSSEGGALDSQTSAELQKNVSVIDQAINESRAALQTQPASVAAQESLFEALRSKVALLQDTVSLINEMRKGDSDGAARIISGLNQ
jgi:anti-sigma factor RsiW